MNDNLNENLTDRAYFVAGQQPWFRAANDPNAQKAIEEARDFLNQLPRNMQSPHVSGGTVSNPEHIITFYWSVSGYPTIKGASISFKGNGLCDLSWDELDGTHYQRNDISIDEVHKINLPEKLNSLLNTGGKGFERAPKLS